MKRTIRIGARLIIASAVFLIPVGMMLFLIVAGARGSVETARFERRGVESLRSIAGLFRAAAERGAEPGIDTLVASLEEEYASVPDRPAEAGALIRQIRAAFDSLADSGGWEQLAVHSNLVGNLRALAARVGGDFSLILETEAAGYYLADVSLRALPQSLERICLIGNLLRLAREQESFPGGSFSAADRAAVADYLNLLKNADLPQVLSGIEAALACLQSYPADTGAGDLYSFGSYRSALERFAAGLAVHNSGASHDAVYDEVFAAERLAAGEACKLMTAALDQLDTLLQRRIEGEWARLIRSLLITVFTLVLAFAVVIVTSMSISGNIRRLQGLFTTLGQNDLSVRVAVTSNDEFGELMGAFNGFLQQLGAAFDSFNRDVSTLASAVFDLSASAKEISTTANEQSASVAEILSTMEGNKNLSAQGAAKTQEVAELALKTQDLSRRGAELRDANQEMMGMIRDQNGKMIEEINSLADMLARINESIALIDSIADQTKLIAFNASLEAAATVNAGGLNTDGAGDGVNTDAENARFSVVAAEIRRFADNVVDSTTEIKEQIREVQQASRNLTEEAGNGRQRIDQGYERMVQQKEVFERIVEVSKNVAERSAQISALSKQQEYASSQIFTALQEISGGVNQFVTATASTSKIADNLNLMSVGLRKVLETYRTAPPQGAARPNGGEQTWQTR
ncbi:MAG: methyl-accepting chemotaxis protein [Treponema sp.]|jgi:methyl-accepting chemotaxis protein|nr:methyl-accepting chemotaxis protein [Treponema sp.]